MDKLLHYLADAHASKINKNYFNAIKYNLLALSEAVAISTRMLICLELSSAYLYSGDLINSVHYLELANDCTEGSEGICTSISYLYESLDQHFQSMMYAEKAYKINSNAINAQRCYVTYINNGKYQEAINIILMHDIFNTQAIASLCAAYIYLQDKDQLTYYISQIPNRSKDCTENFIFAISNLLLKNYSLSLKFMRRAIKYGSTDRKEYYRLWLLLLFKLTNRDFDKRKYALYFTRNYFYPIQEGDFYLSMHLLSINANYLVLKEYSYFEAHKNSIDEHFPCNLVDLFLLILDSDFSYHNSDYADIFSKYESNRFHSSLYHFVAKNWL